MDAAFNLEGYITDVAVPEESPAVGITVKALEELGQGESEVIALLRGNQRRYEPAGNVVIKEGDILILQGEPSALERLVALEKLKLTRDHKTHAVDTPNDEIGIMEAVITPESELVSSSAGQLKLFDRHGVNLLAVSRKGRRIAHRLRSVKLKAGDVVVLQGNLTTMPETFGELHCLPLAPIGHQCNTLVMGPGGYRFGDYWRLGLPLSLIVLIVGVPLIALFWPD
jgi:di/tricarboxylate transporter